MLINILAAICISIIVLVAIGCIISIIIWQKEDDGMSGLLKDTLKDLYDYEIK